MRRVLAISIAEVLHYFVNCSPFFLRQFQWFRRLLETGTGAISKIGTLSFTKTEMSSRLPTGMREIGVEPDARGSCFIMPSFHADSSPYLLWQPVPRDRCCPHSELPTRER